MPTRKQKAIQYIDIQKCQGLELGPLNKPMLKKHEANIFYADHTDTDKLREIYKDDKSVKLEEIVEIDYILGTKKLSSKKFDYIIASHVIEHVPDIITWLQSLHALLSKNGILSLIIPDKRYTFDVNRNTTSIGEVLANYYKTEQTPTLEQILDFTTEAVEVDTQQLWNGVFSKTQKKLFSKEEIKKRAKEKINNNEMYQDTHCTVFTPASFIKILRELIEFDLLPFEIVDFIDTEQNDMEFFIKLKKVDVSTHTKEKLIASLPKIEDFSNEELTYELKTTNKKLKEIYSSRSWRLILVLKWVKSTLSFKK